MYSVELDKDKVLAGRKAGVVKRYSEYKGK